MESASQSADSPSTQQDKPKEDDKESTFDCNICLEPASDPVISMCGHLFCWPCILQWIQSPGDRPCPVCKSVISKEKLIPLYGRGKEQKDPRANSVPRPQGQYARAESQPQQPFFQTPFGAHNNAFYGGPDTNFSFSMGFGLFPSIFGLQFMQFPFQQPQPGGQRMTQEQIDNQQLSRTFLMVGIFVLLCLILF
eukprot:TRINITY_DN3094_c0_g1_i2.p1 TRINITY_DN3094_c0_g1~~TRINITY_DN3094_c0_g1_i2.p1  ORF type:complete len:194 (-),score=10.67 TRINITY_DN3094_c0_g1_i2:58-639(-)